MAGLPQCDGDDAARHGAPRSPAVSSDGSFATNSGMAMEERAGLRSRKVAQPVLFQAVQGNSMSIESLLNNVKVRERVAADGQARLEHVPLHLAGPPGNEP